MNRNQLLRYYFKLRDEAAEFSGYSRLELHLLAKVKLFPLLLDDDDNFNLETVDVAMLNNIDSVSLKLLSDQGLEIFVEAFKTLLFDTFNFVL